MCRASERIHGIWMESVVQEIREIEQPECDRKCYATEPINHMRSLFALEDNKTIVIIMVIFWFLSLPFPSPATPFVIVVVHDDLVWCIQYTCIRNLVKQTFHFDRSVFLHFFFCGLDLEIPMVIIQHRGFLNQKMIINTMLLI